jgi:hypothetical protein
LSLDGESQPGHKDERSFHIFHMNE